MRKKANLATMVVEFREEKGFATCETLAEGTCQDLKFGGNKTYVGWNMTYLCRGGVRFSSAPAPGPASVLHLEEPMVKLSAWGLELASAKVP